MNSYVWSEETGNNTAIGKYLTKVEFRYISKYLKLDSHKKVLDIGGGDGRFAKKLIEKGFEVDIIEYSKAATTELRKNKYPYKVINGDGGKLNEYFEKNSYDAVLAIEIAPLTDKENIENILDQVNHVLKENGVFIVTTYNSFSFHALLKKIFKKNNDYESLYYNQSYWRLKKYLKKKFVIINCIGFRSVPVKRHSNKQKLVRIFEVFETVFFLRKLTFFLPWNIWAMKKK